MKKRNSYKIIAGVLTLSIIIVLLLTGPAQAFILGLVIDDNEVNKGEIITFTASVEIEAEEYLDPDYLILRLTGPMNINCKFNVDGSVIEGCLGMSIIQTSSPPYNYGYGFEKGKLKYKITLNTDYYEPGVYETYLGVFVEEGIVEEKGENIVIRKEVKELEGCSIRAKDGELIAEGKNFEEGKFNFHIPLGNAVNGKGSLTGQKDKNRFSYKFDIINILENNENYAEILIYGEYKIDGGEKKQETAIISIDKINNKLSLNSDNISIGDVDITFKKGCRF